MIKLPKLFQLNFRQKGFTLLELLVVISIIGILIAISTAAFSTAQKKSRDAKRRADIKSLQNTFEQFYVQNDSKYDAADCKNMVTAPDGTQIMPGGWPADPVSSKAYSCPSFSATSYCVCADLDVANGNTNDNCTNLTSTGGTKFCLTSLQ